MKVPNCVLWGLTKRWNSYVVKNNSNTFSLDPLNLTGLHNASSAGKIRYSLQASSVTTSSVLMSRRSSPRKTRVSEDNSMCSSGTSPTTNGPRERNRVSLEQSTPPTPSTEMSTLLPRSSRTSLTSQKAPKRKPSRDSGDCTSPRETKSAPKKKEPGNEKNNY